ncbi:hypothetical protein ABZP36_001389 [Zizania latifolia]
MARLLRFVPPKTTASLIGPHLYPSRASRVLTPPSSLLLCRNDGIILALACKSLALETVAPPTISGMERAIIDRAAAPMTALTLTNSLGTHPHAQNNTDWTTMASVATRVSTGSFLEDFIWQSLLPLIVPINTETLKMLDDDDRKVVLTILEDNLDENALQLVKVLRSAANANRDLV